jgi:CheY-like chemotaxis protein
MQAHRTGLEIILADDDADDRYFFREALALFDSEARLTECEDGDQLMKLLKNYPSPPPPHIIFLDINMPRMNGKECLKEIRSNKSFADIPVVMITTSGASRDIDECFSSGASMYVQKAYSLKEGIETLKRIFKSYYESSLLNKPKDSFFAV